MKHKLKLIAIATLSAALLSACNSGNSTAVYDEYYGPEEGMSPGYYSAMLAKIVNADADVAKSIETASYYYSHVTIDKSIVGNGFVIDCIPFEQQPSLFYATAEVKAAALQRMVQYSGGSLPSFAYDTNACPSGDIALSRARLAAYSNGNLFKKVSSNTTNSHSLNYSDAGYSYVLSPINLITPNNAVFTILNNNGQTPIVPANGSHQLNQLWWITTNGGTNQTQSLETGWIYSNYFTANSATTLFTFSTPNAYGSNSQSNQYNLAGGFIQNPGTPAFGAPLSDVQYKFEYQQNQDGSGYELFITPFKLVSGSYQFESAIDMGYWPQSHFSGYSGFSANPNFKYLQTGSEVYAESTSVVSMVGTIYGYGSYSPTATSSWYPDGSISLDWYPINSGTFTPTLSSYIASFATQSWALNSTIISLNSVTFAGRN